MAKLGNEVERHGSSLACLPWQTAGLPRRQPPPLSSHLSLRAEWCWAGKEELRVSGTVVVLSPHALFGADCPWEVTAVLEIAFREQPVSDLAQSKGGHHLLPRGLGGQLVHHFLASGFSSRVLLEHGAGSMETQLALCGPDGDSDEGPRKRHGL